MIEVISPSTNLQYVRLLSAKVRIHPTKCTVKMRELLQFLLGLLGGNGAAVPPGKEVRF